MVDKSQKKQPSIIAEVAIGLIIVLIFIVQSVRLNVAQRLYDWGVQYKAMGWPAGSREAFNWAATFGHGSPIAIAAIRYRDTKLPRHPVVGDAIALNIQGYRANEEGDRASARRIFVECIRLYPDFEWPYNNLFSLCIDEGKLGEGEIYGRKAIELNPKYVNVLVNMAILKEQQNDPAEARSYLNRALEADPTDPGAISMNLKLKES